MISYARQQGIDAVVKEKHSDAVWKLITAEQTAALTADKAPVGDQVHVIAVVPENPKQQGLFHVPELYPLRHPVLGAVAQVQQIWHQGGGPDGLSVLRGVRHIEVVVRQEAVEIAVVKVVIAA